MTPSDVDYQRAVDLLLAGELVAIPTETVYGLGADAANPAAVAKMKAPVLVRLLQQDVDIKQAAIASNEGGGARMSALEQARVDGERLGDLSDFEADEEGNFNTRANLPFIRRFLGTGR